MRLNLRRLGKIISCLLMIAALVLPAIGAGAARADPGWYDSSWSCRKKITIDSAQVIVTLTDFPVLINLTSDSNLASEAQDDGDDILFTAADGTTQLDHEIEKFSGTTGSLTAWVRIPTLSDSTDSDIYMYYGNGSAASQQNATGVWDSNYVMVQHLEEGSGQHLDSTSNNNDSVSVAVTQQGADIGQVDGADELDGINDYISLGDIGALSNNTYSVSAWIKAPSAWPRQEMVWGAVTGTGNERLCFEIYHGKIYFRDDYCLYISTGGNAIQADTWHYVVATYDYPSQQASVYIDGVYKAGDTYFCQASSSLGVLILGRRGTSCEYYLDGIIDEVRFSDTDRGTGWIQTSYSNQSNPSGFYTLGPAECQPSVPAVTTGNATLVEETTATLHGTITDDGGESCQYRFQWGTTQGGPYTDNTTWIGSKTTGQSFSAAITGLGKGTKYYFIAEAKNSTGTDNGTELSFLTKPDPPDPFTATAVSDTRIDLSWVKGDGAENTMVRRKTGTYPASITDGDEVFFDTGTNTSDIGLSPDTTYYYSAWSEVTGSQQWSDAYAAVITTTGSAPPPPPPPTAVGGTVYPVNKAQVLAPWLCFFLVLSLAVGRAVFSLRKMA